MNRPVFLLIGTGTALGLNFPIGKLAMAAGVHPALWSAVISLGAGIAVLLISMIFEGGGEKSGPKAKFAVISGLVSYVVPNFLTFSAVPKIGSGLAAIMFALSPVVTALLSLVLRVRPPRLLEMAGIGVGLAGALIIIASRNLNFSTGNSAWLLIALLIPLFLGIGNVYRTLAWPRGSGPMQLAAFTNLAAVPPLLVLTLLMTGTVDIAPLYAHPGLVVAQLAVSTTMFVMFFQLQQIGGPTYLSQIGYVAAAVGAGIGILLLGETYPAMVWIGASTVGLGVAISTVAQLRRPPPH